MGPDELAQVTFTDGDVTSLDSIGRVLDEHEVTNVIHLAALQVPFVRANPILGSQVNVTGTVNVFEAVRARSERITAPILWASSAAVFSLDDAAEVARNEDARSQPGTLYGVFKLANEGTARIYHQENGIPSIGLRPYTVYGPGRDQGVTAAPTHAMAAAARGEAYRMGYGGGMFLNYAADVAKTIVQASRSGYTGSGTFNVPGVYAHMRDVVAAIEAEVPAARGTITFEEAPLPFPEELAVGGLERAIGPIPVTPLAEAVAATVAHFRAQA
jgi:nucleoside-diphosphate-sugar epimerase